MSKLNVTTQDLFLRLGATSMTRSTKADALFRRLRFNEQDQIASILTGAPRRIEAANFDGMPVPKSHQTTTAPKSIR